LATIRRRKGSKPTRWQWRVVLKGAPARYGTCPTKECATTCAAVAEAAIKSGKPRHRLTLAEIIDLYIDTHLPTIADSAQHYKVHLKFWRAQLGKYTAATITPSLIAEARVRLTKLPGRTGAARSPATLNRFVNTLASVYSWARRRQQGFVESNPVHGVEKLKEPKGRVRFLSRPTDGADSELERLLAACKESESPILYDVVCLLLATGCRQGEILSLRRSDIRLTEGGFTIPAERTKTESARFVSLEGIALEAIRRRLRVPSIGSPFIFPSSRRGCHASFPTLAWKKALKRAAIADFRPHDLRHTHGSYLAMLGKTLPEIMAALGHATTTVAMRYVHLADAAKRGVSREMNDQLSSWLQGET
jgi:integrase